MQKQLNVTVLKVNSIAFLKLGKFVTILVMFLVVKLYSHFNFCHFHLKLCKNETLLIYFVVIYHSVVYFGLSVILNYRRELSFIFMSMFKSSLFRRENIVYLKFQYQSKSNYGKIQSLMVSKLRSLCYFGVHIIFLLEHLCRLSIICDVLVYI